MGDIDTSLTGRQRRRCAPVVMLWLGLAVSGCGLIEAPVLDPKGPIALAERDLLFTRPGLMLIVVIPVFVMAFWFAWRYRASNRHAGYAPDWPIRPRSMRSSGSCRR